AVDLDEVPRGVAEVSEADAPVGAIDDLARLGAAVSESRQSGLQVVDTEDEHRAVSGFTEVDDLRLPVPPHDRERRAAARIEVGVSLRLGPPRRREADHVAVEAEAGRRVLDQQPDVRQLHALRLTRITARAWRRCRPAGTSTPSRCRTTRTP